MSAGSNSGMPPKRMCFGKDDRYCSHCGYIIFNQMGVKHVFCPKVGCQEKLPFCDANQDWYRCLTYDSFLQKAMRYCPSCGRGQPSVIQRMTTQAKEIEAKLKKVLALKNKQLDWGKNSDKKLEEANAEIAKLRDMVKKQDDEIISKTLEGVAMEAMFEKDVEL